MAFGQKTARRASRLVLCVLPLVLLWCKAARAQEAATTEAKSPSVKTVALDQKVIEARVKEIDAQQDLKPEEKQKLLDAYNQALLQLKQATQWSEAAAKLDKEAKDAPELLKKIRDEAKQPVKEPQPSPPAKASLAQLGQLAGQAEADLRAAQAAADALEAEPKRRADARLEIRKRLPEAKDQLDKLKQQLTSAKPQPDVSPELQHAQTLALKAHIKSLEAEIDKYQKQTNSYDARTELLTARRDDASRQVTQAQRLVKAWQDLVADRRRDDAKLAAQQAREARVAAANAHPKVRELAEENAQLAEQRTGPNGLSRKIDRVTKESDTVAKLLAKVKDEYAGSAEKIKAAGLTNAIGVYLRKKRAELPALREHRRSARVRQKEISKVQLDLINYEEERSKLTNIDGGVDELVGSINAPLSDSERQDVREEAKKLLGARRKLLDDVINDLNTYFARLIELDTSERRMIQAVSEYERFIDERILWFKSTEPLRGSDLHRCLGAVQWIVQPAGWKQVLVVLWAEGTDYPAFAGLVLTVFLALMVFKQKFRGRIKSAAARVVRPDTDSLALTFEVLLMTVLTAVAVPLLLLVIGWRLATSLSAQEFARTVGVGLEVMSVIYLPMQFLRRTCGPNGLGAAHFRWSQSTLRVVTRNLLWLIPTLLPLYFLTAMLHAQSNEPWANSLGRLCFIARMVVIAFFLKKVLRPSGEVMTDVVRRSPGGWLDRLRYIWYPVLVLMPLALAVIAGLGYYYTAQRLERRFLFTMLLVVGVVLLNALVFRWLFVIRRRLAIRRAKERQEAHRLEEDKERVGARGEAAAEPVRRPEEPQTSLYAMSVDTRKLIHNFIFLGVLVGMWFIWSDVLPALGVLKRIHLWSTTVSVSETVKSLEGKDSARSVQKSVPVSLAALMLSIVIVVVTVAAAKRLPSFVEIVILERLPLDRGVRFAITTICRYVITIIGFVFALGNIGIGWSHIQLIAAGMTVGLGFGLQEIFANFISGLILLFEQPMRVGDTVTVGDISGTVTRIHIRATTITDWDRKELIVPNKEFITGRLVNWSLSDSILRLVIPVGIAYGSDTALVEKTLLEVATANGSVLRDPVPSVLFKDFGGSSLDFELRVFIPSIEHYIPVMHKLHMAIDNAFRERDIEISFPQRDVHIRSVEAPFTLLRPKQQDGETGVE